MKAHVNWLAILREVRSTVLACMRMRVAAAAIEKS